MWLLEAPSPNIIFFSFYLCVGVLYRVLNLPSDFDAEFWSARWSSGGYSSWNIAKYHGKIQRYIAIMHYKIVAYSATCQSLDICKSEHRTGSSGSQARLLTSMGADEWSQARDTQVSKLSAIPFASLAREFADSGAITKMSAHLQKCGGQTTCSVQ